MPDVHAVECADGQHRPPRKREVFVCDDLQRNLPSKSVLLRIGGTHTFRKQVFIPRSRLIFWYVLRVSAFREVGAACLCRKTGFSSGEICFSRTETPCRNFSVSSACVSGNSFSHRASICVSVSRRPAMAALCRRVGRILRRCITSCLPLVSVMSLNVRRSKRANRNPKDTKAAILHAFYSGGWG